MYRKDEVIIRVGGAAGDGVDSMGETLARVFTRQGLHAHGLKYYQSVIRGGLMGWNVRIGNHPIKSQGDYIDILIALTPLSAEVYGARMRPGGYLICDERTKFDESKITEGVRIFRLPLVATAREYDMKLKVLKNPVAMGAVLRILGVDSKYLKDLLADQFKSKGEHIVKINQELVDKGYELAKDIPPYDHELKLGGEPRIFMSGNHAAAVGGIAGGLKFYSAYPMTPASSILHFLAAMAPKYDLVVKQVEDELGVINAAIGAAYAGARSMCATSGGGFALMTEAVGLAGMTEIPVVVINSMRGGPSTGLPTNTEQGDLNQLFGASQGDYPRAIIAALSVEDAYYTIVEALNLAEKYQMPVLVALDLYLSEHFETVEPFNLEVEIYQRERPHEEGERYLRYKFTESGISPRSIPGEKGFEHVAASDEHDEDSTLISDVRAGLPDMLEIRKKMVEKRGRKLLHVVKDLRPLVRYGPEDADMTIVGWGSTAGVIQEAVDILNAEGIKANSIHIRYIYPFQVKEVSDALNKAKMRMIVEMNYSGQMRRHIRAETGIWIEHALLKYNGDYLQPEEVVKKVKELLTN